MLTFVWCDGSTLDTDVVLLDSFGGIDGYLVVGLSQDQSSCPQDTYFRAHLVTVLHTQIVVLEVNVQIRQDEFLPDFLPDDTGHLISVQLDDRVLDLDLLRDSGGRCRGRSWRRRGKAKEDSRARSAYIYSRS